MNLRALPVRQPSLLLLAAAAWVGLLALPVLRHAPNRLLSGVALGPSSLGWPGAFAVLAAGILLVTAFVKRTRVLTWMALLAAAALPIAFMVAAGFSAIGLAEGVSDTARTSLGAGAWLIILSGLLAEAEATRHLKLKPWVRLLIVLLTFAGFVLPAAFGWFDQLALIREWRAKQDTFADALWQHGAIVLSAIIPTLIIGLPLGFWAHRSAATRRPLLAGLNLVQTIPSIALFGLLMAPLTALGDAVPWLRDFGIRGIGTFPAIIALTLYALLPVVRNTVSGLDSVPASLLEAARGQGLTRTQIFWQVETPLAAPVLLAGLRITVVQTIGLAAVAALIGAGGLGAIMFQGLFANANDLILLGAVPIVVLAVAADILFRLATESLRKSAS